MPSHIPYEIERISNLPLLVHRRPFDPTEQVFVLEYFYCQQFRLIFLKSLQVHRHFQWISPAVFLQFF